MNLRNRMLVSLTLLWAALTAACASMAQGQPPARGSVLEGTDWVLVSLQGHALIENTSITLGFGDTAIKGSGGCNTYGGSYATSEERLTLSSVYWTEMGCPEPEGVLEQEQAYFQALGAVARYRVDGERLELYDENDVAALIFASSAADGTAVGATPAGMATEPTLDCTLDVDETYGVGEPVTLWFGLHNPTDRPLYVLTWATPLEGMTGESFELTRNSTKLSYQGMLVKRADPTQDEYVLIEPGGTTSAQVDLRAGYDLTVPGSYQVQFIARLQDVTDDGTLLPRKRDDHRSQSLSCNEVAFNIVQTPEAESAGPAAAATPTDTPSTAPTGLRRYVDDTSSVSVWVPESWTIIEPGPHGGPAILQSYPQDKYVGGEAREPGDTKCDLTIHEPEASVTDVIQQLRSDPLTTIVSEREIVLASGRPGTRFELESMGRSLSLVTEVNERAVVLTCFGDLTPFDEIAITLASGE